MSVFADKKFEELDWISQATEPIDSKLNEILGELPDEVVIDFKLYKQMIGDSYSFDLSLDRCISFSIYNSTSSQSLTWEQRDAIRPCFKFESEGDPIINFENQEITGGTIKMVKIQSTMDEKVLESLLGREGIMQVNSMFFSGPGISRANEIMELLGGCESGLKTRSERRKRVTIKSRLIKLFKENEWKIKDTELANKVGFWISSYIVDGNLAALSNFCRLKVMTHKGQPIYSMEEVK